MSRQKIKRFRDSGFTPIFVYAAVMIARWPKLCQFGAVVDMVQCFVAMTFSSVQIWQRQFKSGTSNKYVIFKSGSSNK